MKKLITLYQIKNLDKLAKYADGFIIGSNDFSARLTNGFTIEEINLIIEKSTKIKKEIFLNVNRMFTDKEISIFEEIIKKIDVNNLSGIIVADIGTFMALDQLGFGSKVIYNPETLLTNTTDFNYLSSNNIKGAFIAKEITLEDIVTIGREKKYQMFMVGHGHLNMFYSKRYLLDNYQELIDGDNSYTNNQKLTIIEPKRKDSPYPIYQDNAGTHVFRSKVMNSFGFVEKLESVVDYFIIDTLFKDDNYGLRVLELYDKQDDEKISKLKDDYNEEWDFGFLDNKTYYKRKMSK